MAGICSYGGYVPRCRLNRMQIYKAMGWMNPGNIANAKGEKAVANFDEDTVTMAVAAGLNAIGGMDRDEIQAVYLASTTMPYKERLNAGIVSSALGLSDDVATADFSGSLKSGTSALLAAMDAVAAKRAEKAVVAASETRLGQPASPQELIFGDAAAAFVVGEDNVLAECKGNYSITVDFVDHFRGLESKFDRQWEDRWIRDLGYESLIPRVINGLLEKCGIKMEDVSKVVYDCHYPAARKSLNRKLGITPEMEQTNYQTKVGLCGSAQSMLMLAGALEEAKPGDKIVVVSFGSGCDAILFEATDKITEANTARGVSAALANRSELDNYTKYLVWRDILPSDTGMRGDEDVWTRWTSQYRRYKLINGLWGGKCKECGTPQLPPEKVCVNPECHAVDALEPYLFSDKIGKVKSFTGDNLAANLNPPAVYGQVEFEGGGKFLFDFTDCDLKDVATGMKVEMSFRRRKFDAKRGISSYFWKAIPCKEEK